MQDELLMRDWTALHEDFVAGLRSGRGRPGGRHRAENSSYDTIELAYRLPAGDPSPRLSPAAQASLRGFAASVVTALLWMTLMTLAIPAISLTSAPELPATHTASARTYPALA